MADRLKPRAPLLLLALTLVATGCRAPAGPVVDGPGRVLGPTRALRIGVASIDVTPDKGYPLGGYGGGLRRQRFPALFGAGVLGRLSLDLRQSLSGDDPEARSFYLRGAEGTHDPLFARAFVILPEGEAAIAICRLDLVVMSAAIHEAVLARVQARLDISADRLLICATHTHSGVAAYHQGTFPKLIALDNYRPEVFEALVDGAAEAILEAARGARPASLGVTRILDRAPSDGGIGRNRRARSLDVDPAATDPEILALVARALPEAKPAAGSEPAAESDEPDEIIGAILNLAVHPTVLGPENLYFSGDLAGAIERRVSEALPGAPPVLFINGAEGDIGPNQEGLEHRSGLHACEGIAARCAELVAPAIAAAETYETAAFSSARVERDFGTPFAILTPADRRAFLEGARNPASILTSALLLPADLPLWLLGVIEARLVLTWNLRIGLYADLRLYAESTTFPMSALRMRLGGGAEEVTLLGIPGEATHDVGLSLRARARERGSTRTLLLGLCNDAMSYIASEEAWYAGGYEAGVTLFGPETAAALEGALERAMDRVYEAP